MENPAIKRFGRYEIVGELGRGAMGVVYKARDPQIDRLVALKTVVLRGQDPEAEDEFRKRFLNEAQAAGRLHHPGIVTIFDVGEEPENHDPYIVLEYVAGEALNKILAREKKLPIEKALQLAEEIATALDYAHSQGVTHRDIKPGNILITQTGHAKIADFGIAKLNLAHFTLPGRVLGTPAYMAPEQLSGEGADGRSDLFSLGVILYAMSTGHSPFQGNSATTVCYKVANREPVAASVLDLNLPRELDAVIARAMEKDPEARYQCGADFAADLRLLQVQHQQHHSTTSFLRAGSKAGSVTATRTQRTAQSALSGEPVVGLAYAAKLIRSALRKAPVRDIVLGMATIIMLVIVGVQSKLLTGSRDTAEESAQIEELHQNQNQSQPGQPRPTQARPDRAQTTKVPPVPALPASNVRAERKTLKHAAPTVRAVTLRKKPAKVLPANSVQPVKEVVVASSMVELTVRHQFKDATLTVWVDDQQTLSRPLRGGTQKHLMVFGEVRGLDSETLKIPAGKHLLRFRAQTADQTVDLSKTISADLIGGDDKTLLITFDKHNSVMHVEWQ
ncbi:MAG TPA: serine/threonine-protein kinase [Terriglobales bacterium]|nr:serine/threonine-protein kinase [Terriglobales bacterium]